MLNPVPVNDLSDPIPDEPLYEARRRIYPQSVSGRLRSVKWLVLAITLGIYYVLPFIRWDRGPGAPNQAVLIDFPNRRFYFFFVEIWPQEVYYFTGLLVLAALILFLMNAVAGRVWCGYLCPQTVWTDLFLAIERFVEGDRRERMLADAGQWTVGRLGRKVAKHILWLTVAWWTGGAWVLYFADAPTLVKQLASVEAPAIAWISIGTLTFTTYFLAGYMREQVCTYMCPWPRIQAALTDEYALNVTYRYDRGEPRHSFKKSVALRESGQSSGDCVDCNQCVVVCPTGVDIRNGSQLACIQCGLCIDACNNIMQKIGRPQGLIAYDTELNIRRRKAGQAEIFRVIRPRTILYSVLIAAVALIMLTALTTRSDIAISVLHDRNPLFVRLADGSIRNAFTIRVLNKSNETKKFMLSIDGLPGSRFEVVGARQQTGNEAEIDVGPDQTRELRLTVTVSDLPAAEHSVPITVRIMDLKTAKSTGANDHFLGPER